MQYPGRHLELQDDYDRLSEAVLARHLQAIDAELHLGEYVSHSFTMYLWHTESTYFANNGISTQYWPVFSLQWLTWLRVVESPFLGFVQGNSDRLKYCTQNLVILRK
jgi:hypothetical protein